MDPSTDDSASHADRLVELARHRDFDAFEVRAEVSRARLYITERRGDWHITPSGMVGVSIRVWRGNAAALASLIDPSPTEFAGLLDRADRLVRAGARHAGHTFAPSLRSTCFSSRPNITGDPFEVGDEQPVAIMREAREAALAILPDAQTARSSFSASDRRVHMVNSAGGSSDIRHYHAGSFAQVIHKLGERVGDHAEIEGGVYGLDDMRQAGVPARLGERAATLALEGARAEVVKAGRYRVLVDNEMSGLLAHESFGHLTEYDLMTTGWSVLNERLGDRLADERLNIVDAPTPAGGGRVGVHVAVDDEGTRGHDVRILDRGVFKSAMHQRDSAQATHAAPTGNGRALSVRFPPIVRMRNTFVEPGDMSVEEAIESLGDGIYLCGGRGGSPHSDGSFMFTSSHGYRVEAGRIVAPIKGTSMVGNILHFLPHIEGITKDFRMFSNTFAGCGKWDQSYLHVAMGGPHILASDVLLGGQTVSGSAA